MNEVCIRGYPSLIQASHLYDNVHTIHKKSQEISLLQSPLLGVGKHSTTNQHKIP